MKVKECRFLNINDKQDNTPNWSRRFEYKYVYDQIVENVNGLYSVHNTSCGFSKLHWDFAESISAIRRGVGDHFTNSDLFDKNPLDFENYWKYDILTPSPFEYDCVINISTVEDFINPKTIKKAFNNLLNHARKRLIITCDIYDKVDHRMFIDILGLPKDWDFKEEGALTGANSTHPQYEFSGIRILLIDVEKD